MTGCQLYQPQIDICLPSFRCCATGTASEQTSLSKIVFPAVTLLRRGSSSLPMKGFVMTTGTVKWFNTTKGFGFIQPTGGTKDVFVHVSALERAGIRQLDDGQAVSFDLERDRNGRDSATNLALA